MPVQSMTRSPRETTTIGVHLIYQVERDRSVWQQNCSPS
ncbi:hypothetical protein AHF37_10192 [Paragonimus kellicotti]|nr:hypothetical protein AHF37_10192 [Paragonimus kellicotti]